MINYKDITIETFDTPSGVKIDINNLIDSFNSKVMPDSLGEYFCNYISNFQYLNKSGTTLAVTNNNDDLWDGEWGYVLTENSIYLAKGLGRSIKLVQLVEYIQDLGITRYISGHLHPLGDNRIFYIEKLVKDNVFVDSDYKIIVDEVDVTAVTEYPLINKTIVIGADELFLPEFPNNDRFKKKIKPFPYKELIDSKFLLCYDKTNSFAPKSHMYYMHIPSLGKPSSSDLRLSNGINGYEIISTAKHFTIYNSTADIKNVVAVYDLSNGSKLGVDIVDLDPINPIPERGFDDEGASYTPDYDWDQAYYKILKNDGNVVYYNYLHQIITKPISGNSTSAFNDLKFATRYYNIEGRNDGTFLHQVYDSHLETVDNIG